MGIQQKLHTKLVQKLILTPSLQQAIKLLPMSTLELSDLLNQEMVENPMLEEVPTEELQPAEAAAAQEKTDPEQQAEQDRHLGRPGLRVLLRRLSRRRLSAAGAAGGQRAAADREHALDGQFALRSPDVAAVDADRRPALREIGSAIIGNLDDDGYLVASFDELAAMGPWPVADVERALRADSELRSRPASRRATCRSACCCSCAISGSKARPPRRSSPIICACCRTIRCRRSPASSG